MRGLIEKNKTLVLLLIVILGFFLRLRGLDRVGLNEDEVNKVRAARAAALPSRINTSQS